VNEGGRFGGWKKMACIDGEVGFLLYRVGEFWLKPDLRCLLFRWLKPTANCSDSLEQIMELAEKAIYSICFS